MAKKWSRFSNVLTLVAILVLLVIVFRRMKFVSFLETNEAQKIAVKAYLDENKDKLKANMFGVYGRFKDVTKDKVVLDKVVKAAGENKYNELVEILNSL